MISSKRNFAKNAKSPYEKDDVKELNYIVHDLQIHRFDEMFLENFQHYVWLDKC